MTSYSFVEDGSVPDVPQGTLSPTDVLITNQPIPKLNYFSFCC